MRTLNTKNQASTLFIRSYPIFKGVGSFTSVVDGWGKGFVDELNYESEAANSERFRASMAERGFNASITAPLVFKVRHPRLPRCGLSILLTRARSLVFFYPERVVAQGYNL